jgi:hypothetical protein
MSACVVPSADLRIKKIEVRNKAVIEKEEN